jgi:Bacterial PH domain
MVMDHKVFPIARGSSAALWFCGVIGVLLLGVGALIGTLSFLGSRIVRLEVSEQGLRVRGDMYGRFTPRASLQVGKARALDLGAEPGYAPESRTNGTGLPNYQSGWFKLANGSAALLCVTDWSRTVLVPTSENFDLLVSPADPQAFLAALRQPASTVATFPISASAPSSTSAPVLLVLLPSVLIPVAVAALLGYIAYSTRSVTFDVSTEGVRIKGDMFGRLIPRTSVQVEDAQIMNLKTEPEHRPTLRTFGVGLPGYGSGWFRLKGGGKGLLFLSDPTRAVYLPTTDGYTLVISPADPEAFLAALKA